MEFDEMFETWRAQNAAPPYDVNQDALRQALDAEDTKVRAEIRTWRRGLWVTGIIGTGMAIWAGFWIAITITNGWPVIYAIASGVSLVLFALAAGSAWIGRGREPRRNFGNTLQEEVRRNLALVDYQLSLTGRWIVPMLGTAALVVGVGLFSWTINKSQDIREASSGIGWFWFTAVFVFLVSKAYSKWRDDMRQTKPKLEMRQRRLRELLAGLTARE